MNTKQVTDESKIDPIINTMTIGFPLPVGEWLPGYYGAIALKHKNGSWCISHSNQVDPTSEWRSSSDKVQSGPEMLREGGYIAWMPLDLQLATIPVEPVQSPDASAAAIAHVLDHDNEDDDHDKLNFLRLWNEGEFEVLRREWPEAPEDIYIGADHLHPKSPKLTNAPSSGFLAVGTLSVFEDREATWGYSYDISNKMAGHQLLQTLDGAALYADTGSGLQAVGTLSVFEDKEATFGHGYDISTDMAGHKLLQTLDNAQLYAVKAPVDNGK